MAPDDAGDEAQHEADRDGEDHHRQLRLAEDVAQDRPVQQPAHRGHGEDCADAREPERQSQVRLVGEPHREEGAEHHQVALREVDLLGRLVDQHEAERDQAVDAAVGEAADDELKVLQVPVPDDVTVAGAMASPDPGLGFRSRGPGSVLNRSTGWTGAHPRSGGAHGFQRSRVGVMGLGVVRGWGFGFGHAVLSGISCEIIGSYGESQWSMGMGWAV